MFFYYFYVFLFSKQEASKAGPSTTTNSQLGATGVGVQPGTQLPGTPQTCGPPTPQAATPQPTTPGLITTPGVGFGTPVFPTTPGIPGTPTTDIKPNLTEIKEEPKTPGSGLGGFSGDKEEGKVSL